MKRKIDDGLVFSIRLLNGKYGFGQLVNRQKPIFYMVGYDFQSDVPDIDDETLRHLKPLLLGNFFDVLIRNGRWIPVRHAAPPTVPYPCFKIKIGDTFYIESWDRERKREGTEAELSQLLPRSHYGPIILENALNASLGLGAWDKIFDALKVDAVSRVSGMC